MKKCPFIAPMISQCIKQDCNFWVEEMNDCLIKTGIVTLLNINGILFRALQLAESIIYSQEEEEEKIEPKDQIKSSTEQQTKPIELVKK